MTGTCEETQRWTRGVPVLCYEITEEVETAKRDVMPEEEKDLQLHARRLLGPAQAVEKGQS